MNEGEQSLLYHCSELLILHFLCPLLSLTNYDYEAGKKSNPGSASLGSLCRFTAEQAELFWKTECVFHCFSM